MTGSLRTASEEAVKALLDSFLNCRRHLARMVGSIVRPEEIEDIVQETFVQSYAASRRQEIRNPQAFMMCVARNIALDHVGRAEHKLGCSLEHVDEADLASHFDTELDYQSEEIFLEFCRAVAGLPIACRRVFILSKIYGLSMAEVGERLGISVSTVEKHIARGLFVVLEHMHRKGYARAARHGRVASRGATGGYR